MVDIRDPKVQKWFLGLIGVFVIVYIWHAQVYKPAQEKIEMSYMRYETLQTQLKSVEMKFQSLPALKREYEELTDRYMLVAQLLPEEDQLAPLLSKIHAAALETSTRIGDITPQPSMAQGFYDRADFKLDVYSTYHDLGDFLARIANLPFIVNVSDVHMESVEEYNTPADPLDEFSMMATLTISTYKVKDSERLMLSDL